MSADSVSLVIPGRNCAATIGACLESACALLDAARGPLREIIFVDDGSTDATPRIAGQFAVQCLRGEGRGAGSARNIGWRAAQFPLIWFMDADCVAEPEVLIHLLEHMNDPKVGGVSGTYSNLHTRSLLACLIHEEIVERHLHMGPRVNFLATFNVVYRRAALERVGGFDERYLKAQDAELSFRVMAAGYELRFERNARVGHHHETSWRNYLRTQKRHGYWRVFLHMEHRGHAGGDSYSGLTDHVQPPLAVGAITLAPVALLSSVQWPLVVCLALLAAAQGPMTIRLLRRLKGWKYACYAWMGFVRAFWRGAGMMHGAAGYVLRPRRAPSQPVPRDAAEPREVDVS